MESFVISINLEIYIITHYLCVSNYELLGIHESKFH